VPKLIFVVFTSDYCPVFIMLIAGNSPSNGVENEGSYQECNALIRQENIRISYTFYRFSLVLAIFLLIQLLPYLCDKNFVCFTAKRNKVGVISTFFYFIRNYFSGIRSSRMQ